MNSSLQKEYKAIALGGITTLGLAIVLTSTGLIIIDPDDSSTPLIIAINTLSFVFFWSVISFSIYKFSALKILSLVGLLVAAAIADHFMNIRDNPITIPSIILFWLGVTSLILSQFFKKHKITILSVYGLVLSYYFFVFTTTPNYGQDHRQDFASFMLFPIPVFTALWFYEQWRWLKTLKADKDKAELALLKSQVNPHFFFNTLNNLYGLVVEHSAQAPEVVLKLSDMMRYTIYEGKKDRVNLTDEINYLATYIELHKIRYQKKLEITFNHDVKKEVQVAPLLFIILLENAFKHGAERLTKNAYIHLELELRDNQVFFTIENNHEATTSKQEAGIGLDNLQQRLAHLYPNRHNLRIKKTASAYTAHLNLDLRL